VFIGLSVSLFIRSLYFFPHFPSSQFSFKLKH